MGRSKFYSNLRRSITNMVRKDLDPISRRAINNITKPTNRTNKDSYIDKLVKIRESYPEPDIVYEEDRNAPIGVTVTDNYVIEEYPKPRSSSVLSYRTKKMYSRKYKTDILLKIAVLKSGKTKVTSIWFPKDSERAKKLMKMYNITESRVPIVVTATKRPYTIKKVTPIQIEIAEKIKAIKPKVVTRKADVGATWKNIKGAK
ncbi:MAG: hypothetical protein QXD03_04790 [Candidatus Anstonellales archaeon]